MGGSDGESYDLPCDVEAAVRDPRLGPGEFALWLAYRSYETDGMGAFPGDAMLADHFGMSERWVQEHRYALMEAGFLDQTLRGRKPATYRAVLPDDVDVDHNDDDAGDEYPTPSEATGGNYPDAFEDAWSAYPDREGSNPKKAAYRRWLATVRNGADPEELLEATRIYADRMEREGNVGGRFVKQAKTFFGRDDFWRDELENGRPPADTGTDLDRQRAALDALDGGNGE